VSEHIAPLNLPTLAAFPPWGDSEGAGRVPLTGAKVNHFFGMRKKK